MEKTFLRMKNKASARHAYLEAEVITGLAHQIRAVRLQRGLTQGALAERMATTQAVVSRLEDPSYGRYSLKTLMDLAKTFDTGLQVRFVSFVTMLAQTYVPDAKAREVVSFEDEAPSVGFYQAGAGTGPSIYIAAVRPGESAVASYLSIEIPQAAGSSKLFSANLISHP